jgi:hypothetical protein
MLRLLVSVDIDEPTKMAASAALRRAFLSSTVDIRSWTIHAIDGVEDHNDPQLALLLEEAVPEDLRVELDGDAQIGRELAERGE